MSELVDQIRQWQRSLNGTPQLIQPRTSRTLAVGCVDARIRTDDIVTSDGAPLFPDGKSMVRNILGKAFGPGSPEGDEEARMLKTAIERDGVNRITFMGHSFCGGANACYHQKGSPALQEYLKPHRPLSVEVAQRPGNEATKLRHFEAELVLGSVERVQKHPVIQQALKDEKLVIEPYLLNTATQTAYDLRHEPYLFTETPPDHKPEMAVICSRDAGLFPQEDLNVQDGKLLILRTDDGVVRGEKNGLLQEKAFVEFAVSMGVKDIVVLDKTRPDESPEERRDKQKRLQLSTMALETYPSVRLAKSNGVAVRGWMVDAATQDISEVDRGGRLHLLSEKAHSVPARF